MVEIRSYPFVRHLRADAVDHIQYFRKGNRVRSGRGLAFWFRPEGASIMEIPMDDRALPFLVKGQSADYQDMTVQGSVVWRVADPERLGERIDFTVDPTTGHRVAEPLDQVNGAVVDLARQFANAYLKRHGVRDLLEGGTAPLQAAIGSALLADETLAGMGLAIVGVAVADLRPSVELARALQAPTFESLQQQADEASFARRALAVEKERAIAENELGNRIELAARQQELIAREAENQHAEAEAEAAARLIGAEAQAARIRAVDQAKADMERERVAVYADLPPPVLMALAAREFDFGRRIRFDDF